MEHITHRTLTINGLRIHVAEQGSGPLIVLLHGFPSLWYCWRHQISFLAKAGYHVVAPDLRGFGQSDVPAEVSEYTLLHTAGDAIGLIEAMGEKQAFVVGHDWGSWVASAVALFRPDVVRGLVNLTVPYSARHPEFDMLTELRMLKGDRVYMQRWQNSEDGESEADFTKHGTKVGIAKLMSLHNTEIIEAKNGKTVLESLELPEPMPTWLTEEDLQYYANNFDKTGFTGGFNYYRAIRMNWELMSPWTNQGVTAAALFISGDQDPDVSMFPSGPVYKQLVPNLRDIIFLPGVGHCLMEEAPDRVNEHLLKFFKEN